MTKKHARHLPKLVLDQFTAAQQELIRKHGTVAQFAIACFETVPEFCSYDEAEAAIQKYRAEFNAAATFPLPTRAAGS